MQMMDMRYENHVIEIKDFLDPALDVYARLNEVQLLNRQDLSQGMFIAESPKVIERALDGGYEPVSFLAEDTLLEREALPLAARCPGVPVYTASADILRNLTGLSHDERYPLRHAQKASAHPGAGVCHSFPGGGAGACGEPHQRGGDFPFCGGSFHGCGAADKGLQQSALSAGSPGEYGNGFPDSVDVCGCGSRLARSGHGESAAAGISNRGPWPFARIR